MPMMRTLRGPHPAVVLWLSLIAGIGASPPGRATAPLGPVGDAFTQELLDTTPIPAGMGALLVASLTHPALEPLVRVMAGADRVASGATGQRLIMPAGRYVVLLGQGPESWRPRTEVEVVAGETTIAPPFFSALRVTAVDTYDRPVAQPYVLVGAGGQRVWGPEECSTALDYAATRTWILAPGHVDLVLGRSATRHDARMALALPVGEVVDYRLVVDEGRLVRGEFADRPLARRDDLFSVDWTVGGSLTFGQAKAQLGGYNGESLRLEAFTSFEGGIDHLHHLALVRLQIDQGWVMLDTDGGRSLPLQKVVDDTLFEVLYTYRFGGVVGPYARGMGQMSFFPTKFYPSTDTHVDVRDTSGTIVESYDVAADDDVTLMPAFAPITLQEGVGIAVDPLREVRWVDLWARFGAAARQTFYRGQARYLKSAKRGQLDLLALDDARLFGVELTVGLRLRIGRWVSLASTLDGFLPLDALFGESRFDPLYRSDSMLSLHLNDWAALTYRITLHRDHVAIDKVQYRQSLNLRFSYAIF